MRYREAYFRDEIEIIEDQMIKTISTEDLTRTGTRKMHRNITKELETITHKAVTFNKIIYGFIEEQAKAFAKDPKNIVTFDNWATGCGLMMEEYIKSKDNQEVLLVARLYNQGFFNAFLEKLKNETKTKEECSSPTTDNAHTQDTNTETTA